MNIVDLNAWSSLLDKMIVVGGSARSGTTIMGKLINSLHGVEYQFEPPLLTSLLLKEDELSIKSLKELLQFYFVDNFLLDALAGRNINLNAYDDSCILKVKSKQDIKKRYQQSQSRIALEEAVKQTTFSFKLPEIVFFLKIISTLFPKSTRILMHRNPNDVINSIYRKKWFSDQSLNEKHPSQVFAVKVMNDIKVPYWIQSNDEMFWVQATELERCAYYYQRISEEILYHSKNSLIVNYDQFIIAPDQVFTQIVEEIGLRYGEKTEEILGSVKYQEKERKDYLADLDEELLSQVINLDLQLKSLSL